MSGRLFLNYNTKYILLFMPFFIFISKINTNESSLKFLNLEEKPNSINKNFDLKNENNERLLQTATNSTAIPTTNTVILTNSTATPTNTSASTNTTQKVITKFNFPTCQSNSDCANNGVCDTITKACICKTGYFTLFDNSTAKQTPDNFTLLYDYSNQKMCTYQQKSQVTAFMLSIFVGFGAEHFYLGRISQAISKLVFYIFCGFLNILYLVIYKCIPDGDKIVTFIHNFEAIYLGCGVFYLILWNIYDWVNIGYNNYVDSNNLPLIAWG